MAQAISLAIGGGGGGSAKTTQSGDLQGGDAVGDLNAALTAIAEFTEAVALIEAAVAEIDVYVATGKAVCRQRNWDTKHKK